MKNILVPFDFSTEAEYALELSTQIAKESASSVTLVNVIEHPTPSSFKTMGVEDYDPMENVYISALISKVKNGMEEVMSNKAYSEINLNYKIVLGNAFNELMEEIDSSKADLVIMGTKGSSGLEEFFVGSNAEKIVRFAKCPVITLRERVSIHEIEDIVFASDFKKTTRKFVEELQKLQDFFDAQIRLVKINTPATFSKMGDDIADMKSFIGKYKLSNLSLEVYNHFTEEEGIIAYAEDIDAGIIAMGTHKRSGISHFFNDSMAEEVVNHASRPVWTFNLDA